MKLIVGLGNPGRAYDDTRHNVGFIVLDRLGRRYAPGAVARSKFQAAVLETTINDEKPVLLKPVTYMNRSGQTVAEVVRFFQLDPATALLVLGDDIDTEQIIDQPIQRTERQTKVKVTSAPGSLEATPLLLGPVSSPLRSGPV